MSPAGRGAFAGASAAFCLFVSPSHPAPADQVERGIEAAVKVAALAPVPVVDIVCPMIEEQAEARGLPPMFLMRLIFKESRFDPKAVSPKGAQGIAQFMPGTAADRGLADPFEPKSAIVHSASLLADLKAQFGNIGLAAAAYNAGAERVRGWLAGRSKLPAETQGYVAFITGRPADDWKLPETELPSSLKAPEEPVVESCRKLSTIVVRAVYETEPLTASGAWRPWGVHVSSSFSKGAALAQFARLKQRFGETLANAEPFVVPQRNLSRGRRSLYTVQIGAGSRNDAVETCNLLRKKGGSCIVQKN